MIFEPETLGSQSNNQKARILARFGPRF